MIRVLTSSATDDGFEHSTWVKPKTITLAFATSLLSMQHLGVRATTSWHRIRTMCPGGATCLHPDCCFSELATDVVSSNLDKGEMYKIMCYSLSVTCDRSEVFSGSSDSSTNKTDRHDIAEILLKLALSTIKQTNKQTNKQKK
jgi:hypothetical protein